jgi:hypothetical protein
MKNWWSESKKARRLGNEAWENGMGWRQGGKKGGRVKREKGKL